MSLFYVVRFSLLCGGCAALLDQLGNLTLEFTVETSSSLSGRTVLSAAGIVTEAAVDTVVDNMFLVYFPNATTLQVLNNGGGAATAEFTVPNLADGQEHHLAIVRNQASGVVSLYIDGTLVANDSTPLDTLILDRGAIVLGQEQDAVGGGFQSSLFRTDTPFLTTMHRPPTIHLQFCRRLDSAP